jgi:hypothetical protein
MILYTTKEKYYIGKVTRANETFLVYDRRQTFDNADLQDLPSVRKIRVENSKLIL